MSNSSIHVLQIPDSLTARFSYTVAAVTAQTSLDFNVLSTAPVHPRTSQHKKGLLQYKGRDKTDHM